MPACEDGDTSSGSADRDRPGRSARALRRRRARPGRLDRREQYLASFEQLATKLDARRRRPDHPGGREGQVLPVDADRPRGRPLHSLVPERIGATAETLRDYEAILAKLAIDHADLELADFEPPAGTTRLRDFIDERWGEAAPRTRKKVRAVLMSFFKWAQAEFKLQGNPVVPIRSPRLRDVERELFSAEDVARVVAAQPELRDRVALKLLFLMGLRKGELAATRYRDFDLGRRRLRVHGKGGKIRHTPIPTEELRQEIAELSLRRDPQEHLLYPQKRGPKGTVIWENRRKPLSGPALHRWWYRCLARAGVVDPGTTHGKKMHGARYTSGTEFYLATGDIYATQQLLGHADVSTTANIYVQGSPADLEAKLRKVWGE
jgi:integrase/recombinase XerD